MEDRGQSGVEPVIARTQRPVGVVVPLVGRENACLRNAGNRLRKALKQSDADACGSCRTERCGAVGEGCNIVQTDAAKVGNDLLPDSGFCAAADDVKVRNLVALAQNV